MLLKETKRQMQSAGFPTMNTAHLCMGVCLIRSWGVIEENDYASFLFAQKNNKSRDGV